MITQEEKNKRQKVIDFARGNVRYEGVILSDAVEEINQRYINGEIDKKEHTEHCISQIKLEHELEIQKTKLLDRLNSCIGTLSNKSTVEKN